MVELALLYDRVRWEEKALAREAGALGVTLKMVDVKELALDLAGKPELGFMAALQRCVSHFRGLHVTAYLEAKGVKVVNSYRVQEVCGNKALTTIKLAGAGVPVPRTLLALSPGAAVRAAERIGFPVVLKPVVGSWGRLVAPLTDRQVAEVFIESRAERGGAFDNIFYVQEMVKRPPRDIRCIVVGDRVVASVYRHAPPGEWRTNVARGGWTEPYRLEGEGEELILRAAEAVGGGVLGVDAMEGPEGLVVHEVNSTVEFRGASRAVDVNIAREIVQYLVEVARG